MAEPGLPDPGAKTSEGHITVMPSYDAHSQTAPAVLSPGAVLAVSEALMTMDTFNRDQVAYLLAHFYEQGRRHGAAEEVAETAACWQDYADPQVTREQRIAQRHVGMLAGMERQARRPKPNRLRLVDDVAWPAVKLPGTANAAYLAGLGGHAPCGCGGEGQHIVPERFPTAAGQRGALQVVA